MLKNRKFLILALILLIVSMTLNFPFPHENRYGESLVSIFGRPITTVNGPALVGIASFSLFIAGLFLLAKSLTKYQSRLILLTILISTIAPPYLAELFQRTMATGIYAISYNHDESNCRFEMTNKTILHGECELPFENYSQDVVQFSIEFYEKYANEDDVPIVSLMNNNAPYKVRLNGKESRRVKIETNINISKMLHHIESAGANGVNIIIKSGKNKRKL